MFYNSRLPLAARVLILIAIGTLPILFVVIHTAVSQRAIEEKNASTEIVHLARLAANKQNQLIENTHQLFSTLSLLPQTTLQTPQTCDQILQQILFRNTSIYSDIFVLQPNGDILCGAQPYQAGANKKGQQYLQLAIQTRTLSVSGFMATPKPELFISFPVMDKAGDIVTVLVASLDLISLSQTLSDLALPPDSSVTIFDSQGTIIAHFPYPSEWIGKTILNPRETLQRLQYVNELTVNHTSSNGTERQSTYVRLTKPFEGFLSISVPASYIYARADYFSNLYFFLVISAFILSLILTRILLTAFIFRPINDLISETEKLSKGDLNIRLGNAHPHSEIGALRHAINSLATTLRRQTEKQDITERLIRLQETQFRAIADFSSNWEYWINPDGAFGYVSSACERISGYKPEEFSCDADVLKNILHPDDRESFNAHCQDNHTSPSNQHSPIEFRILTKGGKLRWIFHTCQPVFDPAHLYLGRRATNQDITERKTAEEALRSSEERFRNMIETQAEGIAILNTDTEFIFVNAAAEVIFCALPHNLVGHNIQEFLESEQLSLFNTLLNSSQKDEKTTHEINITRLDGQKRILLVTVTPQFAKDSSFTGIMGIFRDVTDIKQREERLRFTSTHDRLTGLFNRNYLEEEIQKLQQSELWPISIIVVDMDDLKLINDKYGHIHGDKALQRAAAILKNLFRPWDIVARYGGDEFVVLLPEIDANQGKDILRRVKQAINSFNQTHPDKMVNVSVGLATGEKGTSLKKVFQQADEQMYLDKQSKE